MNAVDRFCNTCGDRFSPRNSGHFYCTYCAAEYQRRLARERARVVTRTVVNNTVVNTTRTVPSANSVSAGPFLAVLAVLLLALVVPFLATLVWVVLGVVVAAFVLFNL